MKSILKYLLGLIILVVLANACQYKFSEEELLPGPNPEDTISFSSDIIPIWNNNDKCTRCHGGTIPPDLSPDNAYDNLFDNDLVDLDNPDQSGIYTIPLSDNHQVEQYTDTEAAFVLQWIEQGALDN